MAAGATYTRNQAEVVARNDDLALSTADATTAIQFTPDITGSYAFEAFGYVANATTTLTVTVGYSDPGAPSASNPVTADVIDAADLAVGPFSYSYAVRALGGSQVTVTATAGTASNIVLSVVAQRI